MTVYLDAVVLLNFLVDGLLMLGTNRLTGYPPGWKRVLPAATVGGLYAGVCMLPHFHVLGGIFFRIVILALMSVIAFGWNWSAFRRGTVFVLLSMALGGIMLGFDGSGFITLLLAAGTIALLCRFGLKNPVGAQQYQHVELQWKGRRLELTALIDTGNTLRDPVSGATVLIAGMDVAQQLDIPRAFVEDPIAGVCAGTLSGARLIPYRAVGCPNGMLLAVRCEQVKLDGRTVSSVVAFTPERLGSKSTYQVLAGGV